MVSKISQSQKDKHRVIPPTRGVKFRETDSGIMLSQDGCGEEREWGDILMDIEFHCCNMKTVLGANGGDSCKQCEFT